MAVATGVESVIAGSDRLRAARCRAVASRLLRGITLFCVLSLCGCHVTGHPLDQVLVAYDCGDVAAADEQLDSLAERRDAEVEIIELDRAVIDLMAGRPQESLRTLEALRKRLQYLRQADVREHATAALRDESHIAWSGREFEQRMLDNLQILAALLQSDDDAWALTSRGMQGVQSDRRELNDPGTVPSDEEAEESGQQTVSSDDGASAEQPPLDGLPPSRFAANQMTAWLAAAVRSERIQDADAADRLILQAAAWDPAGDESVTGLQTLGTSTSRNSGSLQVIVLAGRIAPWEAERAMPTTAALLAADRILSATGDHSLPPTTSPVLVARPSQRQYAPRFRTRVVVDGHPQQIGQQLVDLNAAAWDSWQANRDQLLARAVVRRVVKKSTVYGAKNALNVSKGSATDFVINAAGAFWESREQADLRHWNLLPAAIEVAQLELPAGDHTVRLQVQTENQSAAESILHEVTLPVTIENGRNTFVLCFRPENRLLGVQSNRVPQ